VVFYDNNTALPFSEDFLMPGRLLIDAKTAFRKTAARVASYLDTCPVSHVLGGHIELDANGRPYPFGSHYHPNEHRLTLSREDLLALAGPLEHFSFYKRYPNFIPFSSSLEFALVWHEMGYP
jgi:hydroxyacylglutathione hydrolase